MLNNIKLLNINSHNNNISKKIRREVIESMNYQNTMCCLFGMQKIRIESDKIVAVGKYYKLYSIFLFSVLTTGMIWSIIINLQASSKESLSIILTTFTSYASMLVAYIVTSINCFMIGPEITKEIFSNFLSIDQNLLLLQNSRKISVKSMVMILHAFYIFLKSFHVLIDLYTWMRLDTAISQICTLVVDFEILHFIINVEITARCFEMLNRRLMNLNLPSCIDFDIKDGLMARLWKRDISTVNSILTGKGIKKCIAVYNQIAEIIDNINISFGLTVMIYNIYILY